MKKLTTRDLFTLLFFSFSRFLKIELTLGFHRLLIFFKALLQTGRHVYKLHSVSDIKITDDTIATFKPICTDIIYFDYRLRPVTTAHTSAKANDQRKFAYYLNA